jgi:hypothetical protein
MINQDDNKDSIEEITAQSNDDSVLNSPEIVTNSLKKNKTFNIVCILSLIWNNICLVTVCSGFYIGAKNYFGITHKDQALNIGFIFATVGIGIMIYSFWLSILGVYKMIKGDGKGYRFFMQGNGIFLVIMAISILNDDTGLAIAVVIILTIFRLIFREYKNKLMNL